LELFPKVSPHRVTGAVTQSLVEFNMQVWKRKRDGGLALKESIKIEVPKKLRPYQADLARMHHIAN